MSSPVTRRAEAVDAEAVEEIVDRLEQELVDQAVPDLLADLVVLVERADHELHDDHDDEVGEGLREGEAVDQRLAGVGRAPEDEDHQEVEEGEEAAHAEVHPVDQVALQPDAEDGAVFVQEGEHGGGDSSE
jgi:hypothetical protein